MRDTNHPRISLLARALPLLVAAACASGHRGGGAGEYELVTCGEGSGETVSEEITDDGGTVQVRDHFLTVPRNAVNRRTRFTITDRPGRYVGVEVGPHGTRFGNGKRAQLTLSYARCGDSLAGYSDLRVVHVRPDTPVVIRVLDSQVDPEARTVTTVEGLEHLSGYLIGGNREGGS